MNVIKVKKYLDDLSTHIGIPRVSILSSFSGDHYLGFNSKKRPRIFALFVISSFYIAEICSGR